MKNGNITSWDKVPIVMDLPYAARIVGVTPENLKKRCQRGQFPAYKEGALWRVEKDELRNYMRMRRAGTFTEDGTWQG